MATATQKKVKTYLLMKHTESTAPVYQRISASQRVRLAKRPLDAALLQITITDRDGENKTLRYKGNCTSIFLHEQIEKYKIPANEKFTDRERSIRYFKNGALVTNNETFQKFLESSPEFDGFWKELDGKPAGDCDEVREPKYILWNPESDIKISNQSTRLRVNAAKMVMDLEDIESAGILLKRLFGSSFQVPTLLEEAQNILIDYVDEADDVQLKDMARTELNVDEKIDILIGTSIDAGILNFEHPDFPDQVVMKKAGKEIPVKSISDQYSLDERKRYLAEFLVSDAGKPLLDDIAGILTALAEKKESTKTKQPAK